MTTAPLLEERLRSRPQGRQLIHAGLNPQALFWRPGPGCFSTPPLRPWNGPWISRRDVCLPCARGPGTLPEARPTAPRSLDTDGVEGDLLACVCSNAGLFTDEGPEGTRPVTVSLLELEKRQTTSWYVSIPDSSGVASQFPSRPPSAHPKLLSSQRLDGGQ